MGNIFKKAVKAVGKATKAVGDAVGDVGRDAIKVTSNVVSQVDITSSKSLAGKALGEKGRDLARQAVGTAKMGTGVGIWEYVGGKVLPGKVGDYLESQSETTVKYAKKGAATGASIGAAIWAGKGVSEIGRQAIGQVMTGGQAAAAQDAPATSTTSTVATDESFLQKLIHLAFPSV